jgi:hypothetical protein
MSERSKKPIAPTFPIWREAVTSRAAKNQAVHPFFRKNGGRIQKPFRMISLRKIRQQLPWIDILTKNTGGWGYIPFCNPPIFANTAALGAGSKPFAAGRSVLHLEHTS